MNKRFKALSVTTTYNEKWKPIERDKRERESNILPVEHNVGAKTTGTSQLLRVCSRARVARVFISELLSGHLALVFVSVVCVCECSSTGACAFRMTLFSRNAKSTERFRARPRDGWTFADWRNDELVTREINELL